MNQPVPPSPLLTLAAVLRSVRGQIGNWHAMGFFSSVLMFLVHRRIVQILGRIERLVERYQAGTLRRVPGRVAGSVALDVAVTERVRASPVDRLPHKFGWLVWAAGWRASCYGGQLQTALHMPEVVELLRAAPQVARILGPVCRMLAIDPRYLQPGVFVGYVPPEAKAPAKKRVRKPRAKVDWGRIPLPRGMLAAARRQGFGKLPKD